MSSVSATHLIMFIASLVVAASVAGTITMQTAQYSESIEIEGDRTADQIETEFTIISDSGSPEAIYDEDAGELTILAKNIGSQDIRDTDITLVIDGGYAPPNSYEVDNVDSNTPEWSPAEVIEITHTDPPNLDGDVQVTLTVDDTTDTIKFRA